MKKGQGRNTISMLGALCSLILIVATFSWREKLQTSAASESVPPATAPGVETMAGEPEPKSANTVLVAPVDVETISKARLGKIENWIDQLAASDREKQLAGAFGESRQGKMLARMLVVSSAYDHSEEVTPLLERLQASYANEFAKDPGAAATAIEAGLGAISAREFPLERSALLATLASVPGEASRAHSLALKELTDWVPEARPKLSADMSEEEKNRVASSTDAAYQLPILAFHSYLDGASDFEDAAQGARAALSAQVDSGVRANIVAALEEKFPQRAGELRQLLGE